MAEKPCFYLFGHSFPARLARAAHSRRQPAANFIGVGTHCDLVIEGHPGLTFSRIFDNLPHYMSKMCAMTRIDVLCIDIGTNDLCEPANTPEQVVQKMFKFLESLEENRIHPRCIVVLSVLQRSKISRSGQISVSTFNHRVRRFNAQLGRALARTRPETHMYAQSRINLPKYFVDGCHLTPAGMKKYQRQIKHIVERFC